MKKHIYKYICKVCGREYFKHDHIEDEQCDECFQEGL